MTYNILSAKGFSCAQVDRTTQKEIYQNQFRIPKDFWFSPNTLEFSGFRLLRSIGIEPEV